ncbi:transport between ER and Golgi ATPase protein [Entophlyctis sp. JEL0112]|nr:transport between ER and Golgi ATPase protein [Entophlyctis sp. JEL0112]
MTYDKVETVNPGFGDFSGIATADFANPFDALLAAASSDPVGACVVEQSECACNCLQRPLTAQAEIAARYDAHRTARNTAQKSKLLSPDFSGFLLDGILRRIVDERGFEDPRNSLVFWARPSTSVRDIIAACQAKLRAAAPNLWLMPADKLHTTVLEVTHSRTPQDVAAIVAQLGAPAVAQIVGLPRTRPTRLVKPLLGFDASAIAISFVPAPDAPYSYHHLRRDVFALVAASAAPIDSRYVVPSAHLTIARFIRDDEFRGADGAIDSAKVHAFVNAIEAVNEWLIREFWPLEDGGSADSAPAEWIIGGETGLICRMGSLWYGDGVTVDQA